MIQVVKPKAVKPVKTNAHMKQYFDWIRSEDNYGDLPKVLHPGIYNTNINY